MRTTTEMPLCGAVELLATIFGRDKRLLKERYGLIRIRRCFVCGAILSKQNRSGFCRDCFKSSKTVTAVCSECERTFEIQVSQLVPRNYRSQTGHLFCGRKCFGSYAGRTYGFVTHPANIRLGALAVLKWDRNEIHALRESTGWGATRIGRHLGIPVSTVSYILHKNHEQRQKSLD